MRTSTDSPPEIMTTGAGFAEFHGTSVFFAAMDPSLSWPTDTTGAPRPAGIASPAVLGAVLPGAEPRFGVDGHRTAAVGAQHRNRSEGTQRLRARMSVDRKSTRLNSSHVSISYAVFCLKKKKNIYTVINCAYDT